MHLITIEKSREPELYYMVYNNEDRYKVLVGSKRPFPGLPALIASIDPFKDTSRMNAFMFLLIEQKANLISLTSYFDSLGFKLINEGRWNTLKMLEDRVVTLRRGKDEFGEDAVILDLSDHRDFLAALAELV